MAMNELQKQTNTNIQEKANLIWEGATHLVGLFKPHEYGKVILPLTVLKRFDDALAPTKQAVLEMKKKLDEGTITMDAIRIHYQDWSASASKCNADGMLRKMDKYYAELFGEAQGRRKKHAYPRSKRANQRRKKKE